MKIIDETVLNLNGDSLTWAEFCSANCEGVDLAEVSEALAMTGRYSDGGGAAPVWTISVPNFLWMSYHTPDDVEEDGELSGDDGEMTLISVSAEYNA